ncbi:hypothetical protein RI367_007346 [Sorochytrium milnesiophthora]
MPTSFEYTPIGAALTSHCTLMLTQAMQLATLPASLWHLSRSLFSADAQVITPPSPPPRTVLITGASAGIGAAVAVEYAKMYPGIRLILIARDEDRLLGTRNNCLYLGASDVQIHSADVRDRAAMRKIIHDTDDQYTIDVVVAQAGILSFTEMDSQAEAEAIEHDKAKYVTEMYDINVAGEFNTIEPIMERFKERRAGKIAVMGSVAGYFSFPNQAFYSGTKAFINVFTRDLQAHLAPYNVSVTLIAPGLIYTRTGKKMIQFGKSTFPSFLFRDAGKMAHAIVQGIANGVEEVSSPIAEWMMCNTMGHALTLSLGSWVSWLGGMTAVGGTHWS